jgi:SAM-dependent methyltransferase
MSTPRIVRRILPPVLMDALRWLRTGPHSVALQRLRYGRIVPGSAPYGRYKRDFLQRALANTELLERFRQNQPLPDGYGIGLDERCVEYPWLFAQLGRGAERLLDAGSVLNHEFLLDHPILRAKTIDILTLAPEESCFWQRRISYLFGDLRDIPMREGFYDSIVCLSTIEHVGCDNTGYTGVERDHEDRPEGFADALRELRRVLRPGGTLFLTVPYGRHRHFGWLQQFDRALLERAVAAWDGSYAPEVTFFRYTVGGWGRSEAGDCSECEYVNLVGRYRAGERFPVPAEPDLAAAARAVACLRLVNS